jgi:hypothetical protein
LKPGQLNFFSTGEGSIAHLGMLVLAKSVFVFLGVEHDEIFTKASG